MDSEASAGGEASTVTELLEAPEGWRKTLVPRKGKTPKRNDVVFVAPNGENIKSKSQLERYLKAHPGGPLISDFNWSTGETPRRSERVISRARRSIDSPNASPPAKKAKKSTPAKKSEKDEITETDLLKDGVGFDDSKEDEEMLDTNPPEKQPLLTENKVPGAEFSDVAECGNAESKYSEEAEVPVKDSKVDNETENRILEETLPTEVQFKQDEEPVNSTFEHHNDQITDNKKLEEPSPVKFSQEDKNDTENKISKGRHVKDSMVEENIATKNIEMESIFETTKDVDLEKPHPVHATDNYEEVVIIKEEIELTVESTEVTENGIVTLEETTEIKFSTEVEAAIETLESSENKKDIANASFSALEIPVQDEHVESIQTESDHANSDISSHMNVTKCQEVCPAEVGVSS